MMDPAFSLLKKKERDVPLSALMGSWQWEVGLGEMRGYLLAAVGRPHRAQNTAFLRFARIQCNRFAPISVCARLKSCI